MATTEKEGDGEKTTSTSYDRWTLQDPSTINYGLCAQTHGIFSSDTTASSASSEDTPPPFYITTAINYTNGPAHMGHAYEGVTSDVICRFYRSLGDRPCFFLTGADEHGQKIATTAASQNQEPMELCNKYVLGFQRLNQRMLISNDDYVRTTSDRHKETARALWNRLYEAGDIYLDSYEGWYNVREEIFVTETDAKLWDYKDPVSGLPLKQVQEQSYFFRMSNYQKQLVEILEDSSSSESSSFTIQPPHQANSILARLQQEELRDLSISRTTFDWGISLPTDDGSTFEPNHVMYVWVDALSNYLTGVVPGLEFDTSKNNDLTKFWPASVHIIGKDILWFHTVIWPCLLLSAGLPLPRQVFAHGFVNDSEGKKMSKSLGNVVDPHDMLDQMEVDTFRYYLCKEAPYGGELSFNVASLEDMHNSDLCDTLGNLVHRATNLCGKYCGGVVPDVPTTRKVALDWPATLKEYRLKMEALELQGGAQVAMTGFRTVNGYLTEEAPWLKKGQDLAAERQSIVKTTLEAIYVLTHLLIPFLPNGAAAIFEKLGTPQKALKDLEDSSSGTNNLVVGTKISVGTVLYTKMGAPAATDSSSKKNNDKKKKESLEEAQRRKKEKKAAAIAASQKGQGASNNASPDQPDFYKLEVRVGKITKVWNHPEADKLYCEEIDLGGGGTRQVASGLRSYYSLEEMQDKLVLVVCNLKATKLVGFASHGMVLAAKGNGSGVVELVEAPQGSELGERVTLEGISDFGGDPLSQAQVKKRKMWDKVAAKLATNDECIATWDGKAIQTSAGPCKVTSLKSAPIS